MRTCATPLSLHIAASAVSFALAAQHYLDADDDYVSPWEAADRAWDLSVERGTFNSPMPLHDMQPLRHRVPDRPLRVRFKDDVSLHTGSADDLAMVPITLPHRASLTRPEKP